MLLHKELNVRFARGTGRGVEGSPMASFDPQQTLTRI